MSQSSPHNGGFVSIALVILILVVLGGGGAAVYYAQNESGSSTQSVPEKVDVFADMRVDTNVAPQAAVPEVKPTVVPEVKKAIAVAQVTTTGIKTCAAKDFNCLIAAARTCSPATLTWSQPLNLFGLVITAQSQLTISSTLKAGMCTFSQNTVDAKVNLTPEVQATLKQQGLTDAQIQQELAETAQSMIGTKTVCTISASRLVTILTNWSRGSFSSDDFAPGECTVTSPSGTSTPAGKTVVTGTTVFLYEKGGNSLDGIGFATESLTAEKLVVTLTDDATGKSQTVSLVPKASVSTMGRTFTLDSIERVRTGSINGEDTYGLKAALSY